MEDLNKLNVLLKNRNWLWMREINRVQLPLAVSDSAEPSPVLINRRMLAVSLPKNQRGIHAFTHQIFMYRHGAFVRKCVIEFHAAYAVGVSVQ